MSFSSGVAADDAMLIESFARSLDARAPTTRDAYRRAVVALQSDLAPRTLAGVNAEQLADHLTRLGGDLGRASIAQRRSALRAFYGWLVEQGVVDRNVALDVHPEPTWTAERPADALGPLHFDDLPDVWSETTWPSRDRAVVAVLLHAGIHADELAELDWTDVDLDRRVLSVRGGRTRSARHIRMDEVLVRELRAWAREVDGTAAVFVNVRARERLGVRSVHRLVADIADAIGEPGMTPRALRGAFLRRRLLAGDDERRLAYEAGYVAPNTLRRALGSLRADTRPCLRCDGAHDLGSVARRCRACLGTGQAIVAPEAYRARLTLRNAVGRLRAWSSELRRYGPELLGRRLLAAPAMGPWDRACDVLLDIAAELASDARAARPPAAIEAMSVDAARLPWRLRAIGVEALKLADAFHGLGLAGPARTSLLRQLGADAVLLAWAVEDGVEHVALWTASGS